MPALYRMPITYIVLLIAGLGWWAFARGPERPMRPGSDLAGETLTRPSVDPVPVPAEVAEIAEESPPAPDLILRTADGWRRKVIITELGVVPRRQPELQEGKGVPLDYLGIRYVFAQTKAMTQIGKGETPDGWIPSGSCLEWDTRLMAKPTNRAGRAVIEIYEDRKCLEAVASGALCPQHSGQCPIIGEEGPDDANSTRAVLGWPILASSAIKLVGGGLTQLLEVAPLVHEQPSPPSEPPADLRPALRTVYIAFVIDTTASMQSTIDSVRETAARVVAEAGKSYKDITLRLGLVAYRDRSSTFGYVTQRVTAFTDAADFAKALTKIEAAAKGDGSIAESVFEGVSLALPGGPDHLDWPTGREAELATKLLVLLGDAPDHDEKLYRAGSLAAQARREQITIATIALKSPTALTRDERARYEAQWEALAEGSYRPPDRRQGFAQPIPPQRYKLSETDGLVSTLVSLIEARIERARQLAAIAAAEAEGRLTEYVNSQGLTAQQVAPLLVDLHRRAGRQANRTNLSHDGKKAPGVRRGWILQRKGGQDLVSIQMLLSREELDVLIRELTSLQQATRGSADDMANLLEVGNAAAAGETSFLAKQRGKETFADHLKRRQGVAPARADSLLLRSRTDLLRADAIDRAALDARLGESILGLIRRRNDPDWTSPGRTVEGKALVSFDLIDF